jgi:hypothetical protein
LVTVAGVVDQHIDRAVGRFDGRHDAFDAVEVRDVQQHAVRIIDRKSLKGLQIGFVAHGPDDAVAGIQRFLGQRVAEAAADAGDEEGFGGGHDGLQ